MNKSDTCETCVYAQDKGHDNLYCRRFPPDMDKPPMVAKDGWCGEYTETPPARKAKPAPVRGKR